MHQYLFKTRAKSFCISSLVGTCGYRATTNSPFLDTDFPLFGFSVIKTKSFGFLLNSDFSLITTLSVNFLTSKLMNSFLARSYRRFKSDKRLFLSVPILLTLGFPFLCVHHVTKDKTVRTINTTRIFSNINFKSPVCFGAF